MKNKTILITGASSGIGKACAQEFAQNGSRIILTARRKEKLDQLAQELTTTYDIETLTVALDVTDQPVIEKTIQSLPDSWSQIDVLINNAGLAKGLDKIDEASITDWDQMIDTNIKGLLYMTRAITPGMKERAQGHVINIGSISARGVYEGGAVYCATKHAVRALNEGMRIDLLGTGVRVTCVDPGLVETDFSMVRFNGDQQRADGVYQKFTPLQAVDIAQTCYFCASRPAHVNINDILVMPTDQANTSYSLAKG